MSQGLPPMNLVLSPQQIGERVRQLGHGVIEWIGPTGRRYADRPPAVVRFVPLADDGPPPF